MANCLLLYPEKLISQPLLPVALSTLLHRIGLIQGENEMTGLLRFAPGHAFSQLISFIGCSPTLNFSGSSDAVSPQIAIKLSEKKSQVQLWTGTNTRTPTCHQCRLPIKTWRELLTQSRQGVLVCTHCHAENAVSGLSWGKTAALTNCYVAIEGIHPREAVPVSSLLHELSKMFQANCMYCYLQDPVSTFEIPWHC